MGGQDGLSSRTGGLMHFSDDDRHWRLDHCARARAPQRAQIRNKMRKPAVYNGKGDAFFFRDARARILYILSLLAIFFLSFFFFPLYFGSVFFFLSLLSLSLSLSLSLILFFLFFSLFLLYSLACIVQFPVSRPLRVVNTREFLPVAIRRLFMAAIAQSADSVIRGLSVARLIVNRMEDTS